jgi:U3 small nucleolar RNA-associated protein 10
MAQQSVLAAQLNKLRAPQTDVLKETKRRVSLLFDNKEAASLDARSVFLIGSEGFNRLVSIDDGFGKFGKVLFAEASREFERAVQTSEINHQLDDLISKFLVRVSPYFLLQPAQEAIEWLLWR